MRTLLVPRFSYLGLRDAVLESSLRMRRGGNHARPSNSLRYLTTGASGVLADARGCGRVRPHRLTSNDRYSIVRER
jgi:hypothetical protein